MTDNNRRNTLRALGALGFAGATGFSPLAFAALKPGKSDALIVVDVQNCFIPGGTLPVQKGDEIVPLINTVAKKFANVVITQDWHTPGHQSFASAHPGKKPFETEKVFYGMQVLWPDHCVQGTQDAAIHKDLDIPHAQLVIRKGYNKDVDSYSAFQEADRKTNTGLAGYLKARGIKTVYVVGLATDFCVAWTAMDARTSGFNAFVIEDLCRGIDLNNSVDAAWKRMAAKGVKRIQSSDIA